MEVVNEDSVNVADFEQIREPHDEQKSAEEDRERDLNEVEADRNDEGTAELPVDGRRAIEDNFHQNRHQEVAERQLR